MGGKKKGKKKGKAKGPDLFNDPDEFKSFNVAQRQVLSTIFARMNELKERNTQLRNEHKEQLETNLQDGKNNVSFQIS